MGTRPRTKRKLKLKARRCFKCSALLHPLRRRCKRCSNAQGI